MRTSAVTVPALITSPRLKCYIHTPGVVLSLPCIWPNLSLDARHVCAIIMAGWEIELREPNKKKMQLKSYAANFHWSRRTRVGQK